MKKKFYRSICLFLMIISLLVPCTAYADMGPKPSVVIHFSGLEDEKYYVTLISQDESTGPYSYGNPYYDWMGEEWVFNKFSSYEMPDGYYFLSYMEDCSDDDTFEWGYYPPQEFRILLYFPEHDTFLEVEGDYARYAFDSYFSVEVDTPTPDSEIIAVQDYYFTLEITSLIARIIATIVIEILIALLFFYRDRKSLLIISVTNIVTQIVLNVLLNIFNFKSGPWAFTSNYVWMELVVFGIEAFLFCRLLPRSDSDAEKNKTALCYAFIANLVSFFLGMLIAHWIPGIF